MFESPFGPSIPIPYHTVSITIASEYNLLLVGKDPDPHCSKKCPGYSYIHKCSNKFQFSKVKISSVFINITLKLKTKVGERRISVI